MAPAPPRPQDACPRPARPAPAAAAGLPRRLPQSAARPRMPAALPAAPRSGDSSARRPAARRGRRARPGRRGRRHAPQTAGAADDPWVEAPLLEVRKRRQQRGAHPWGPRPRWGDAGSVFRRGLEQGPAACRVTVVASTLRRGLQSVGRPWLLAALGGGGRVLGRAALAAVHEALWSDRWTERPTKMGRCGSQCGWAP